MDDLTPIIDDKPASSVSKTLDFVQCPTPPSQVGILVTAELDKATKECREKVERIARSCRASNKKFRDIEFDLEGDADLAYFSLFAASEAEAIAELPKVRRVTEIYEKPCFFVGEPGSNDIRQGALGDCWFLSALSTITTSPGLIHKCCVARDEEVGVYGFVFFRDSHWTSIVIDDQLFWSRPKFEELSKAEQALFHDDKESYNRLSLKSGKGLRFARSGASGETWVPLIEKAYAKLHGDFDSLSGGLLSEAIEDLTGGVSFKINTRDILDTDRFWEEELLRANDHTRLFGVYFDGLDEARSGRSNRVRGLVGPHSYSILRVKEWDGKRFIVLRNPWGHSEWNGRWSDGSKEWTNEGMGALKVLDHVLGNDGEFVMEYSDFLQTWTKIEWTTLFDSTWIMSSHWLHIPPRSSFRPWSYGEVYFNFTLPKASSVVIVLSQLDNRYYKHLEALSLLSVDFVVYKRGEKDCRSWFYPAMWRLRSISCEMELEEGEYVIYPRLDQWPEKLTGYFKDSAELLDKRKLGRVLTERTKSRAIASDYDLKSKAQFIPKTLAAVIEADSKKSLDAVDPGLESGEDDGVVSRSITTTISTTTTVVEEKTTAKPTQKTALDGKSRMHMSAATPRTALPIAVALPTETSSEKPKSDGKDDNIAGDKFQTGDNEDQHPLFLGLRVYSKKDVVVVISGKVTV